jgi:hypothetical protein
MSSHSDKAKRASILMDQIPASHKYFRSTHISLSEPEDSMSSGIESFDEDDMYPMDYDDEAVIDSPASSPDLDGESKSLSGETVCGFNPLSFPVSQICNSMMKSFSRHRAFELKWKTHLPWSWHCAMLRELAQSPARME